MPASLTSARRVLLPALLAAVGACANAGSDLTVGPLPQGSIAVRLFLDRDGTGTPTPADTVFRGARVALLAPNGQDTLRTLTSDGLGIALFENVPVGQYAVGVAAGSIGDTIFVEKIDTTHVRIQATDTLAIVDVRLSYPSFSIRAVRLAAPGRRVFLRGIILAGVQSFRDTTSHLADTSGTLRLTQVALTAGLTGNNPGDSVSVLGLTGTRDGQPVLTQARLIRLATRPAPIPVPISTANAASANGGVLDAALVQITGGIITDTATVAPDFRVTVSDGTGSAVVLLDGNLAFLRTAFRPGRSMDARGVLVPDGTTGKWVMKPRFGGDVVLN